MAKYGRGLICLALSQKQINKLNLSLMSPNNISRTQTAFTVSIEAKKVLQLEFQLMIEHTQLKQQLKKMLNQKILFHQVMFFL